MFKLVVLFVILAGAMSASIKDADNKPAVEILHSMTENKEDGSFNFNYELSDGSFREESGVVTDAGTEDQELVVSGSYHYTDDEGQLIEVKYTASKDGFVPSGSNISPLITMAAQAAVEKARTLRLEEKKH